MKKKKKTVALEFPKKVEVTVTETQDFQNKTGGLYNAKQKK